MFESLQNRLSGAFKSITGKARLSEKNIQDGLREVRLALLEADVNFKVVKDFVEQVKTRALGEDVLKGLNPGQQLIKVVNEELVELLGGEVQGFDLQADRPLKIMMVGLQGSGKTTSSGKLAVYLRKEGFRPYLVPADVYRPAAIEQLTTLAGQINVPVYPSTPDMKPVDICHDALEKAAQAGYDAVLFDTAGRLHIDEPLMEELSAIQEKCSPQEILFVADAMTGQDAVTVAESFNERLNVSGVVLTKMDGDARGGAALSIKKVTGKSVKFVGVGEKLSDLELFYPDRVASRILGMGDILTLIEKAQEEFDEEEAERMAKKMQKAQFDLEDFRTNMRRLKKMGSMEGLLKMIPGMSGMMKQLGDVQMPEKEMARTEAIINSMTVAERRSPKLITQSRKQRIARGSGVQLVDVNTLLGNFNKMSKMMSKMMSGKKGLPPLPGNMPGMEGLGMESLAGTAHPALGSKSSKRTQAARKKKKLAKKQKQKQRKKR